MLQHKNKRMEENNKTGFMKAWLRRKLEKANVNNEKKWQCFDELFESVYCFSLSFVPYVASFSGLPFFGCPFGIL
jgi:hypothetical protein